jgi:hypothetical protein
MIAGVAERTKPDPPYVARLECADSPSTLGVILLSRIALNLQSRVVYPFLPAISRGLGVPLDAASLLLAVRSLVGRVDRLGKRRAVLGGLTLHLLSYLLLPRLAGTLGGAVTGVFDVFDLRVYRGGDHPAGF